MSLSLDTAIYQSSDLCNFVSFESRISHLKNGVNETSVGWLLQGLNEIMPVRYPPGT